MSRTRVKFCGVMTPEDARAAAFAGADAVGMICHANAKRLVDVARARQIVAALPPYVSAIGVFVNADPDVIVDVVNTALLQAAQLHGDESPDSVRHCGTVPVIKVLKADAKLRASLAVWRDAMPALPNLAGLLIDSAGGGGTGVASDFNLIRQLIDDGAFEGLPPVAIAGGLRPENVGGVVSLLRPYAVDTSSGIEECFGEKSIPKMRAFVKAVRNADASGAT